MNKPILSICIPTYNGADSLKQTLEGIVSQFDNLEVKRAVEVVISDNASTDDTADIVKIFQERFDNVKYFKNKENIGFDLNLLNAIKKSKGEYCWMFNDNTVIKTSALAYLLQKLRGECNVYLISGFETVGQKTYDGNELLDNYGLFGGKLDRVILKRDKIPNAEKYIGNLWVHYSLVLEMAIVGKVGVLRELTIPDSTRLSKWARFYCFC